MTRICIAGVGAIGGLVAVRLANAGHTISLIARGERLTRLEKEGLTLHVEGEPPITISAPAGPPTQFDQQDLIIVATKTQSLEMFLPTLRPLMHPRTILVPLVNGIPWWYRDRGGSAIRAADPTGILATVDSGMVMGAIVYMNAWEENGVIHSAGRQRLVIGEPGGKLSSRVMELADLFSAARLSTQASPNIRSDLWTKVALNLATNPLSVVTGATLGTQFTQSDLLTVVTAIIEEVRAVAESEGQTLTMDDHEMIAVGRSAGAFRTSMLQDFSGDRPLELGAITEVCFEIAERNKVAMPVARTVAGITRYLAASRTRVG